MMFLFVLSVTLKGDSYAVDFSTLLHINYFQKRWSSAVFILLFKIWFMVNLQNQCLVSTGKPLCKMSVQLLWLISVFNWPPFLKWHDWVEHLTIYLSLKVISNKNFQCEVNWIALIQQTCMIWFIYSLFHLGNLRILRKSIKWRESKHAADFIKWQRLVLQI